MAERVSPAGRSGPHWAVGLCVLVTACGAPSSEPGPVRRAGRGLTVGEVLGGPATGFAIADGGHELDFPEDHGPHPSFRNEWWYLTGNLSDGERDFGYQLTLFRTALSPDPVERESAWATRQVYMGHLAVGDLAAGEFHAYDRFARGALGLAGARTSPLRVWLEDWEVAFAGGPRASAPTPAQAFGLEGLVPLRARAAAGEVAIDLMLSGERPVVLQGDAGLSRKGSEPANASYYYSATRLPTRGTITIEGRDHAVEGSSWLDREWSTSALESGQAGWDWFALQLDDGMDLMLYVMRRDDGSVDPHSSGVLVEGPEPSRLSAGEFTVRAQSTWKSPRTGAVYPSGWAIVVPAVDLRLEVEPRLAGQELDLAFRYWEGAVAVAGTRAGVPLTGRGFVELTGY